jgi:hypothetical protein
MFGAEQLAVDRPVLEVPVQRGQKQQDEEGDKGENCQEVVHVPTVARGRLEEQWQDCHQASNYCHTSGTLDPC